LEPPFPGSNPGTPAGRGMLELEIYSGRANKVLAEKIASELNKPLGNLEIKNFSDGEIWVKFGDNIRGADVFIIQPTNPPSENLMELLIAIDAAKRASARRITAVIPYFGYARQDRKDQPRVSITAKLIANLLTKAGADRVMTMDLHAPQIQGFFDIPLDHLYSSIVFVNFFKNMNIENLAVSSTDVGGIKMARSYAKRLKAGLILVDKRRQEANSSEVMNVIGEVEGKNVLLVDDLIDTGGSFVNAIKALKDRGANKIYGACTHGILSGNAIEKIENSQIEKLYITDTVPEKRKSNKIEVLSVAKIFAEAITRTNKYQSISSLFDIDKDKI
jgi:ribose-phosphate pyrophosphokinase